MGSIIPKPIITNQGDKQPLLGPGAAGDPWGKLNVWKTHQGIPGRMIYKWNMSTSRETLEGLIRVSTASTLANILEMVSDYQ